MRHRAVYPGILVLVVLALSSLLLIGPRLGTKAQSATACCGTNPITAPRELDFPYYSLRDGFTSTLNLVSDSPEPLDFIIALHSLAGETLLSSSMSIQPSAKLPIDLARLIKSLGSDPTRALSEGSISIYFTGTIMPLVGQVTMTNPSLHLSQEAEMVENDPGRSDIPAVLSGLWWGLSGGRDALIMVANMSGNLVTADVFLDFGGERRQSSPLVFNPNETKVVSIAQLLGELDTSPSQAPEGGITIVQRGSKPSLIAQGRVTDPVTGFSTTLEFPDPARQPASALHAVGLPVGTPPAGSPYSGAGSFTPHVIARNLLDKPQSMTVTVEYPKSGTWNSANGPGGRAAPLVRFVGVLKKGEKDPNEALDNPPNPDPSLLTGQYALAPLTVAPDSTVDFSLAAVVNELPLPIPYASVRIQYSGPPGSVIAQVASVDESQDLVVDARTANELDGWAGSGANPWHVDSQTDSILFLTDEGNKPARIGFSITAGGVHYYLTSLQLAPHETRAIDIRQLRDAQVADFKKNKISANAADGSVSWIRLDNVPITGRVVVFTKKSGMASSYDCCTTNCTASLTDIGFNPTHMILGIGATQQCSVYADFYDCNSVDYPRDETASASWGSSNTSIMTVSPSGVVQGVGAGTANVNASYRGSTYNCSNLCQQSAVTVSNSAMVIVISISGPNAVPLRSGGSANGVNSVQLTANGTPSGGTFSWSTTSGNVTLSNTTSASVTVTSATASTSQGDTPVKVTYTYNGQSGSKTAYITVQKPSVLIVQGPDTTTGEATCNAGAGTGCGVTRTFTYQVLDQIGGGEPINFTGMQVWDSITTGSTNQLGLTGYLTTCTNSGLTNSGPCGVTTNSSGEWLEKSLGVCSTFCYSSGTCVTAGETTASQVWHVNGFALPAQQITYECNKVLVNGG